VELLVKRRKRPDITNGVLKEGGMQNVEGRRQNAEGRRQNAEVRILEMIIWTPAVSP
jgi:hypothetical protein